MSEWDVVALTVFLAIGCAVVAGILYERREWNGGICRETGFGWVYFDTDSGGGRGYTDGFGNYCWISYPLIDCQSLVKSQ